MSGPPLSYDPEAVSPERLRQAAERMMGWAGTDDLEAEREWVDALVRFWEANLNFIGYLLDKVNREDPFGAAYETLPEAAGGAYLQARYGQATLLDACIAKVAAEPVGMLGPNPAP